MATKYIVNNVSGQTINGESILPKYKVYTALLTQSGGDNIIGVAGDENINIGVTYQITDNPDNYDLTIYGAPNNNIGTSFVANQSVLPLPYTNSLQLLANTGAPVVTVLENTIGNVWFEFESNGFYKVVSNSLFINNKTVISNIDSCVVGTGYTVQYYSVLEDSSRISIRTSQGANISELQNNLLQNRPIEIRVYN